MKAFLISAAILAATASAAHASPFGVRPVQIEPRNNQDLRPLPTQSELRVESFRTSLLRCNADLSPQSINVSARLAVQTDPVRGNNAQIDILVDGISKATIAAVSRDGFVTFARSVSVVGLSPGEHEFVFLLNGAVRSAAQRVNISCATLRPSVTEAPVATWPNLAISAPIYIAARRNNGASIQPADGPRRPPITYSFNAPFIIENPRHENFRYLICPPVGGAETSAPLEFAVAITAFMVENPQARFSATTARGRMSAPRYVDTRGGSRWANGDPLGTPNTEGTPLPAGHEWLVFQGTIPCSHSMTNVVLSFDGAGITESSTTDNTVTLRLTTRR